MSKSWLTSVALALLVWAAADAAAQPQQSTDSYARTAQGQPADQPEPYIERQPAQPQRPVPPPPVSATPPASAPAPAPANPLVDRSAGQNSPVPIRIVPSPKSEEQLVAERQEREQRATLENRLMLFAALLAGIGLLQVLAIIILGALMWRALRAVRRP